MLNIGCSGVPQWVHEFSKESELCYAGATSLDNDAKAFRQFCEPAEALLTKSAKGLVRTIGRWSLAALMVNTMIGASIFGLPALIAARLGKWSPLGFLVAFAGISIIAACMAEVASQFRTISCHSEWLADVAEPDCCRLCSRKPVHHLSERILSQG
jgi:hypothetical protein